MADDESLGPFESPPRNLGERLWSERLARTCFSDTPTTPPPPYLSALFEVLLRDRRSHLQRARSSHPSRGIGAEMGRSAQDPREPLGSENEFLELELRARESADFKVYAMYEPYLRVK